ncbi:tape measure protein [Lentilactobacillus hilgardii]|uniref:tape measure protein n=1 Tax=Lentilactobacillus hilgardii TaxID=1588 RepID=UPI00390CD352
MTTISATIKIIDGFSSPLTNLASRLTTAGNAMNRLKGRTAQSGNIFKNVLGANLVGTGITKGLSLIGTGITGLMRNLEESSAAWQTFNGNMAAIGKTPTQITTTRSALQKYAAQTVYSSSDMASAYSQFAAVGVQGTLGLVKGMGGLAAAANKPKQAMATLMQQSIQAAAKPKIQWADFKLMLEQTPSGMRHVANSMGTSLKGLVKDVQAGKISTQKFFNAINKAGNSKGLQTMATHYKTVGDALSGTSDTLTDKLLNAFDSTSKVGIRAISSLNDQINNINFDKMIPGLVSFAKGVVSALTTAGNAVKDFFSGFASSGAIGAIKNTFSSIGNAIGNITSKLNHASGGNLAQTLGSISGAGITVAANAVTMLANALGRLSPGEILAIVGAFAGFKLIGGIMIAAGAGINAFANATQGLSKGLSFIQSLPAMIAAAFSPVGAIILGITAIIVAAVAAWATDFMGFRSVVSGIASAFAPIVSAAQQMLAALAPLGPALSAIFQTIGIGVIAGAALGFAALADSLITIGSAAMVVVHALGAVVNTLGAVGYAITGNFSKAASAMSAAKDDVSGIGSALSHIGSHNTVDAVISALSKLGSTASDTKAKTSNIKVNATGNVSGALTSLTQLQTQAAKPIRTKIEAPTALPTSNIFSQLQSQASSNPIRPKVEAPKLPTGNVFSQLQTQAASNPIKAKVQADTSATGNPLAKLQAQATNTPIKAKVATPKVPTPVMPKGQTMHVNVARPKVPTPIMPKMPTMHVTVARPKVPTPTLPHLGTIPAPHVNRPSMAGIIGAVRSGMTASASAARSGGAQITSAVRSAVNNAAAAARAGAGAMRSAGAAIGAGLAAGMNSQVGAVEAAASRLAAAADKAARAAAKVHSPSKVFAEIGSYMGQGLAIGMNQTNALVASSGTSLANSAINAAHMKSVLGQGMTINSTLSDQSTPTTSPEQLQTILTSGQSVNRSSQSSNSSTITITKGAIQINSQGNSQQDLESLVQQFENYLVNRQRNRLGVEGNE